MTSILLLFYMQQLKSKIKYLLPLVGVFLIVETLFLIANLFKFFHGGWVTILLAGVIFTTMYIWYNARKIKNRQVSFVKIEDYFSLLSDIKNDITIPKYSSNLVYLSKANYKSDIESKIMYSIMNKQPKRADNYWILHVDLVDEPTTLEYDFHVLVPDTLYRIDLKIGFRIQPRINVFFRQIMDDLVSRNEFNPVSSYPSLKKHEIAADFRFVIIHRVFDQMYGFSLKQRFVIHFYSIIRSLGISDSKAYGMDKSNVYVETVPLVVKTDDKRIVKRTVEF